jgi:hypothetical protein
MSERLIQRILKDKPFSDFLKIKDIKSLAGHGAISGESFLVIDEHNKKYKLRLCSTTKQAKRIERNVKILPHAFPKFFGRDGNYVLFEWVEGELFYDVLSKPIPDEVYYQMGKLVGEAHELNDINTSKSADSFFESMIKNIIDVKQVEQSLIDKITRRYEELRDKLKIDIVLEINDIHPRNFIIKNRSNPNKTKIYFVDEDGFGHKIKGLGLAKPFFIEGLIKTNKQRNSFWKGYKEHHSNDYFDKDYQTFVTFVQIVRSMAARSKNNKDISDLIIMIEKYM